jgi:hypothetical protein
MGGGIIGAKPEKAGRLLGDDGPGATLAGSGGRILDGGA